MTPGITKTSKPRMSLHRGRTWDSCTVVLLDGTEIKGYLDTTWGANFYFPHGAGWYRGKIDEFQTGGQYDNVFNLGKRRL